MVPVLDVDAESVRGEIQRAPRIRMLKEPVRHIRFVTHEEAERLLRVLPPHLLDMAAFTLATGLRAPTSPVCNGRRWTW